MLRRTLICSVICWAQTAVAQTVIDGSDAKIEPSDLTRLLAYTTKDMPEPQAAQLRKMRKVADKVFCGEVNSKNRDGTYAGFKPFVADLASNGYLSILPPEDNVRYNTIIIDLNVYNCMPKN